MRVHCLGTTGYHPSPSRHTACYYISELGLVLDAGTGLFKLIGLLREKPRRDLTIFLSHAHLDHVAGLTFLLDVVAVTGLEHVRVYAQSSKVRAIKKHLFHESLFPVPPQFEFVELPGSEGTVPLDGCSIDYFPLEHPGGSIGMLVTAGEKRIAYVTDTTPIQDSKFASRLSGVDLLMHECYFDDTQIEFSRKTGHSWLSAVQKLVRKARPKQTLLIHVNPLAEMIGKPVRLNAKCRELKMRFAKDDMVVRV